MKIYQSGHGAYFAEYHIVWIPKYRRRILNPDVAAYLNHIFPKVFAMMPGTILVKANVQSDHIHMIINIPPRYAVCDVVGLIKGKSASLLRKKFEWLSRVYWKENVVWSPGYFISTVGINEEFILRYVEYQQHQDSGQVAFEF
jgi:putative transposase